MSENNPQRSDEAFASASSGPAVAEVPAPTKPHRATSAPLDSPPSHPAQLRPALLPEQRPSLKSVGIVFGVIIAVALVIGLVWFEGKPFANLGVIPLVMLVAGIAVHLWALTQGRFALAAGAVGLALLVGWHRTFAELWIRWFPAWETHRGSSLTTRMTAGESYYSHGPLVPVCCLVMAFLIYVRVGIPTGATKSYRRWGAIVLTGSLLMQLVGARGDATPVSGFALIGVMAGLGLLWGGWPFMRAYWLPLVFLTFMVPPPMDTIHKINFRLKLNATEAALWVTNQLLGVPAVKTGGSSVHLLPAVACQEKTLVLENVSGGLRSLISLICFGTLFALVCRVKGYWRWFMLALAVPLALACNVVRITSLIIVSHFWSVEAAGEESWFHMFSGIMVFALALAAMFGIERLIIFLAHRFKRDWVDDRIMGYLDELPPSSPAGLRPFHPVATACLSLVLVLTVYWAYDKNDIHRGDIARTAVPDKLEIDGKPYTGVETEMSKTEIAILQTTDGVKRRYTTPGSKEIPGIGPMYIDLSVIFSANNRKGVHPPDVCLEGGGGRIVTKAFNPVTFQGEVKGEPKEMNVEFRELVSENRGFQVLHLYIYKCGDTYTNDYLWQQAVIFLNSLTSRNSAGALIRIDVPIGRSDANATAEARRLGLAAAATFMPMIDKGLP